MSYTPRHAKQDRKKRKRVAAYGAAAIVAALPTSSGAHKVITDNTRPDIPKISAEKHSTADQPAAEPDLAEMTVEMHAIAAKRIVENRRKAYLRHLAAVRAEREWAARRARQAEAARNAPVSSQSQPPPSKPIAPNLAGAAKAIAFAKAQLGKPYIWGGTGPNGFDCSGLVMAAWAYAGVAIPRTSQAQWAGLHHVPTSDMQPGDLLVFYSGASHVGMYLGGGMMIEASEPGTPIKIVAIAGYYMDNLLGVVRP